MVSIPSSLVLICEHKESVPPVQRKCRTQKSEGQKPSFSSRLSPDFMRKYHAAEIWPQPYDKHPKDDVSVSNTLIEELCSRYQEQLMHCLV